MKSRRPGPGSGSQSEVATGDDVVSLAHAENVDQLAGVLESAEADPVVDDLLREGFIESRQRLELFKGRGVEVGARGHGAGGAFCEGDLHLLAIPEPAGEVGKVREVGVGPQTAGSGDRILDAATAGQSVDSRLRDGAGHVDHQTRCGWYVLRRVVGGGLGRGWGGGGGRGEGGARPGG